MKETKQSAKQKKKAEKMSLDAIEDAMTDIAFNSTPKTFFMDKAKIEMLEKVANMKMKKQELELKKEQAALSQVTETESKPITVKFVSADTDEQRERLARLDAEAQISLNGGKTNKA